MLPSSLLHGLRQRGRRPSASATMAMDRAREVAPGEWPTSTRSALLGLEAGLPKQSAQRARLL